MVDSQNFENEVQQLKLLPQYSGMSDDMIRQMILQETPQNTSQNTPLTSGDFGMSTDNQINYGSTSEYPMMSTYDFNLNTQSPKGFDLGKTVGTAQNIYKTIGGKEGINKVKSFLGLSKKADNTMGLNLTNALPTNGTGGLSGLLGKLGIGGGGAGAGAGSGALAGLAPALPFLAVGAGLLALKAKKKKKKLMQKMKAEEEYRERKLEQKQELIDANVEYMQTAQQYNNPYKID
jgi:hypothetical protein